MFRYPSPTSPPIEGEGLGDKIILFIKFIEAGGAEQIIVGLVSCKLLDFLY